MCSVREFLFALNSPQKWLEESREAKWTKKLKKKQTPVSKKVIHPDFFINAKQISLFFNFSASEKRGDIKKASVGDGRCTEPDIKMINRSESENSSSDGRCTEPDTGKANQNEAENSSYKEASEIIPESTVPPPNNKEVVQELTEENQDLNEEVVGEFFSLHKTKA